MPRSLIASILLWAAVSVTPALASDTKCALYKLAELPTASTVLDTLMVPVKVDGFDTRMQVDTGAFWSLIANNLTTGLPVHKARAGMVDAAGSEDRVFVTVPNFELGGHQIHDVDFYLGGPVVQPGIMGGNLGTNVLGLADLEIDPAHARIAFFSREHCPDKVVYWPHTDLVEIPIHVSRYNEIYLQVKLDGQTVWAKLDTGATISVLSADIAERLFGLHPGSEAMEPMGDLKTFTRSVPAQKHQFTTLDIGGVVFGHPLIAISPNKIASTPGYERAIAQAKGEPIELILGMHQLRTLHLYVDYADKMLYATTVAGDAKAAPDRNSASSDATSDQQAAAATVSAPAAQGPALVADSFDAAQVKDIVARGMQALRAHKPEDAISQFDLALAKVPRYPAVLLDRAAAKRDLGNYAAALADVNAAIAMQPLLLQAYAVRSTIYIAQGDLPHAVADAKYIAAVNPKSIGGLIEAGDLLLDAKAPDLALADFDAAVALSPHAVNQQVGRCRALAAQHNYQAAFSACDEAAATEPRNAWPVAARGFVHLAAGQASDAAADFDAALALDRNNAAALYGRSIIRRRKGDTAGADADLAAAKATNSRIERLYDGA